MLWHALCFSMGMNGINLARIGLLALFIALPFSSATAGGLSAVINGKSFHVGASQEFNEENFGIGVEYQFPTETRWKKIVMANGFRDSEEEMSYMAGFGLHRNLYQTDRLNGLYVDAGINAFVMTRKDMNGNRPFPGMLPSLTIGNEVVGVNLTYLPKTAVEQLYDAQMSDQSVDGIVFLQVKISVGE